MCEPGCGERGDGVAGALDRPDGLRGQLMGEIGRVAAAHDAAVLAALSTDEREVLRGLLARVAAEQGLTAGVHPGYRTLPAEAARDPRAGRARAAPA